MEEADCSVFLRVHSRLLFVCIRGYFLCSLRSLAAIIDFQMNLRRKWIVRLVCALSASIAIATWSCVPITPSYVTPTGVTNIRHDSDDYKLAVIEFGELGSYADPFRQELHNTIQLLQKADRPLLVVYIHGWLNNATSDDVGNFQGFLSRLSQSKQVQTHHYNVFGVYFAWPGKSLDIPYLRYLTFLNRKHAAEQIASNGDCIDAIEQLSYAARLRPYNYVFLIGHSFGGLILERTVEHTLRTLQGLQNVKPPWDLAMMLNPASDSVLTRQLVSDLQSLYTYSDKPVPGGVLNWGGQFKPISGTGNSVPENQPTVVELQSENDSATGTFFPIGSKAGVFLNGHWNWNQVKDPASNQTLSEREFYLSTPGNDKYLVNYEIDHPASAPDPLLDKFTQDPEGRDAFDYNLDHNPVGGIFYTSTARDTDTAASSGRKNESAQERPKNNPQVWQLHFVAPHDKYQGVHVPFWIVRVPADIIDNHGGIWSDNNMALMAAIFRMHRPILPNNTIAPAKSYVLPLPPQLKSPSR
jgi:pimeloyl-ACP methyl ester carboxylesterase